MGRAREQLFHWSGLDDTSGVHHGDPVAELRHETEVVRNKDDGELAFALSLVQNLDDLGLNRDV